MWHVPCTTPTVDTLAKRMSCDPCQGPASAGDSTVELPARPTCPDCAQHSVQLRLHKLRAAEDGLRVQHVWPGLRTVAFQASKLDSMIGLLQFYAYCTVFSFGEVLASHYGSVVLSTGCARGVWVVTRFAARCGFITRVVSARGAHCRAAGNMHCRQSGGDCGATGARCYGCIKRRSVK